MARKKVTRRTTKKVGARKRPAARQPARMKKAAGKPPVRTIRPGVITHTELGSTDPRATRAWCEQVLGWKFEGEPVQTPTGPYHMWRFANDTGGGIRTIHPPETPGSIPYCEVVDIQATFAKALAAGGTEIFPPTPLPDGTGSIAIVAAPGGVPIGFWSMK